MMTAEGCSDKSVSTTWLFASYVRQVWPLLLGNVLQWYEFGVYGYLASQMTPNFFPGSQIGTWLGYSVTFLGRPLGGLIFGWTADRLGRRTSTLLSLTGMLAATVGQGLLPSRYCCGTSWGTLGVVLLVVLRSLQGLCTGGEEAAIVPYIAETSPHQIKCLGASLFMVTISCSFLCASGVVFLLESVLTNEQMLLWGWRIPFIISLVPGLLSLWGRHGLTETAEFLEWKKQRQEEVQPAAAEEKPATKSRLRVACRLCCTHWRSFAVLFFGTAFGAVAFYQALWSLSYAVKVLGLSSQAALGTGALMQLVMIVTVPIVAFLSDKSQVGPFPATLIGTSCFTVAVVPLFAVINAAAGNPRVLIPCISIGWGLLLSLVFGTFHMFFVDLFPTQVRATAFGVTFNSSFALFGGFVGVISQVLSGVTRLGAAYYALGVGLLSTTALLWCWCLLAKGTIQLQHFQRSQASDHELSQSNEATVSV